MMQLRDLPGFGSTVDGLSWAISGFDNKDLAFGIAFAILLAALVIWAILSIRRHRPWIRPIRRLSAGLRKLPGNDSDAGGRLAKADEIFEAEPALAPLWREYRKNLKPNPQADGFLNLIDPRLWFSVESFPGRGYEQWCATWAGVFLTVGLLFTFIGLSAALLEVGKIGTDSAAMKEAISRILSISSAKFITSIAGLIAYIGFSLVTRHYQSIQQAAARELADAVQHLSLPVTPELLLYEQNDTARRQLTRMERLTDDLAVAIDAKMEHRLKTLATDLGQQFSKQIQETAGGEINTVAERFTAVAHELASIKGDMGAAGKTFGVDISNAALVLREAAGKMGEKLDDRSQKLAETIGEFGGKLDSISSTLSRVPESIDRALKTTLDKLTDAIGTLVNRLAEGGESGASALTAGGEEAGNRLKASAGQAGQDLQARIGEVSGKLDCIASALGQVPADISRALNETMNKLTGAIDTLVNRLSEGSQNGASALTAGGEEAGNRLKASAGQAGQDLQERVGEVSGKLDSIASALGLVPADISRALNETMSKLTGAIDALVGRLTEGSQSGASALTAGGQEAGNRLKASAGQAGQDLQARIGEVSGKLDSIAGALGQVPADISRALNETMSKLTAATAELTGRLALGGREGGDALREGGQQAGAEIERTIGRAGNEFDRLVTQATGKLVEQFAAAQAGLESAIQDLASQLQTVESSLKTLPGAVATQVQNLDAAGQTFRAAGLTVTDAGNALQQATQPLLQTATTVQTSIDQIRQGVAAAAEIYQQASHSSQAALDGLTRAADAAEYTFKTHEDRFGRADVELAKALGILRAGVEQVANTTREVFTQYDTHITHAVNGLSAVANDFSDVAKTLGDSIQQLADARQRTLQLAPKPGSSQRV